MITIYDDEDDDEPQTIIYVEGMQYDEYLLEIINEKQLIVSLPGMGYSLHDIIYEGYREKIEYNLLYDRNICSYINDLVSGNKLDNSLLRNTIALLAYAQIGKVICEPTIAYYEYAQSSDFSKLKNDMENFSKADNHDFRNYLSYLTGHISISQLSENIRETKGSDYSNFTEEVARKRLVVFKHNLLAIKKATLLMLQGIEHHDMILRLLDWMYKDYLFTGVALPWIIQNITPANRDSKMKGIDFLRIRNWTWDMSLIQYCMQKNLEFKKTRQFCLLASNDKALKKAYQFIARNNEVDSEKELNKLVFELWGDKIAADAISKKYSEVQAKVNDPERMRVKGITNEYLDKMEREIDLSLKEYMKTQNKRINSDPKS